MRSQIEITAYVGLGLERPSLEIKRLEDAIARELEGAGIGGATILEGRGLWRSAEGTMREPCAAIKILIGASDSYRDKAVAAITAAVKAARPNEQEILVSVVTVQAESVKIAE